MNANEATVLDLEAVKAFRKVCDDYVASLQNGIKNLKSATEWVHQGRDGWDDSDYDRIKARVDGIINGMTTIQKKIRTDLLPYVAAKIRVLEKKLGC